MNFSYGVIAAVGVLVAISLGLIAADPGDIIEPRIIPVEEKPTACTLQWDPMCGVDGVTYGNLCMLDATDVKLDYEGECMVVQPETTDMVEIEESITISKSEPEMSAEALPMTLTVSIPKGSGVRGCDETNECFLPYEINVAIGTTITWNNNDTTVHTVTSGNISDGYDGLFDSKIVQSGKSFEFTFNDAGTYDYFCMVHPWMTGIVQVS
ncbi:MAG TPA: plastocyanin/azurin family copper-binding protein [Nitrosopumilus sp.]|nr:plastocyanin/azurin family copper-binding protein [Thermoproteota archaeon]HJJ23566.1 plastocyanin/azurin family copper-binding protein [Nitrosopumilus sp.]